MRYIPFPRGDARAIADARAKGMKPAGAIEIILAGGWLDSPNPKVYVEPDLDYRWDWLKGLPVVLLIDSKTRLDSILSAIDRAAPAQIDVIDRERCLGWQICFTKPRIKAVRWQRAWVQDWLGDGDWHRDLAKAKTDALLDAKAQQQDKHTFEQEAIWN